LSDRETQHKFSGLVGFRYLNPTYNRIYQLSTWNSLIPSTSLPQLFFQIIKLFALPDGAESLENDPIDRVESGCFCLVIGNGDD